MIDGIEVRQTEDGRYLARIDWVDYPVDRSTTVADLVILRDSMRVLIGLKYSADKGHACEMQSLTGWEQ